MRTEDESDRVLKEKNTGQSQSKKLLSVSCMEGYGENNSHLKPPQSSRNSMKKKTEASFLGGSRLMTPKGGKTPKNAKPQTKSVSSMLQALKKQHSDSKPKQPLNESHMTPASEYYFT